MTNTKEVKILLVDDKPGNLLALQAVLESLAHTLVLAHSGKEALSLLLKDDFALILLDVQMPEMDGFEMASLVRSQMKTRYSPIIFLTALGKTKFEMSRGYEVGAVDYLLKPFDAEILRSKVRILVELYQNTAEIKQENAKLAAVNTTMKRTLSERRAALEECGRNLAKTTTELAGFRGAKPA
jgi:response regulator RpfG family c-di-GMP phosphodiesterase